MAKEKKGQKFGRNRDRNPSSRMQKHRTAARKAKAKGSTSPGGPPHPLVPVSRAMKRINEIFALRLLKREIRAMA